MRFTGRLSHCMKFAIWICYWPFPSIIALPYHIGKCYNTLAWNVNRECYWINKTNSYTLGRTFNVFERLAMFFATRLTPLVEWFSLHTTLVLFSASLPNLRPLNSFFSRSLVPPFPSLDSIYIFLSYCGSPLGQMLHVLIHSIGRFVFSSSCCLHQQSLWNGKTFALKRSMHWCWRCRWNDADLKVVSVDYRHGMGKRGESFPVLPSTPGPSSLPLPKMSQITKID